MFEHCFLGHFLFNINNFSLIIVFQVTTHFSGCLENCFESVVLPQKILVSTTDCEINFSWLLDKKNLCILPFNWLIAFQYSCFDLFITRLAFGSPSEKKCLNMKTENASCQFKSLHQSHPGM